MEGAVWGPIRLARFFELAVIGSKYERLILLHLREMVPTVSVGGCGGLQHKGFKLDGFSAILGDRFPVERPIRD